MKPAHIYWFAFYNINSPSVRYRGKYVLDHLNDHYNISHHFIYPGYRPGNVLKVAAAMIQALFFPRRQSLVVVQKLYTRRFYSFALRLLVRLNNNITMFDIDDAEYEKHAPDALHYFMKHCDFCTVGSAALQEYVQQFNPMTEILTSPVIDHQIQKKSRNDRFTIGWIGGYGGYHRESMEALVYPSIQELNFPVHLVLLGVMHDEDELEVRKAFENIDHVSLDIPRDIDWLDEASVYEHIRYFDVGVAPLLDNEIHRSKSAFKMKQYMSCAVPVLATPIGENLTFLESGKNGFLCNSVQEFTIGLTKIHDLPDEQYEAFCENALQSCENFSLDRYCEDLLSFVESHS